MDVLASLFQYCEPVMTVENRSVGPHFERTLLSGEQRAQQIICRDTTEVRQFHWIQCIAAVQEPEQRKFTMIHAGLESGW